MTRKNNRASQATLASLGERGLLNWILPRLRAHDRHRYIVPPGDDAAVLSSIGKPVLSIDGLTDGTHFKLSWTARVKKFGFSLGRGLGWKLLGSSLSDLAAMGDVDNRWAMIFVGAPASLRSSFLKEFFGGLQERATRSRCTLVGGDTVESATLTLVAAVGGNLKSKPLTRSGARIGDLIGIAGTVGDAARGLDILENRSRVPLAASRPFVRRFFEHVPLFEAGKVLARTRGVSSLMDLSDSLSESMDLLLPPEKFGFRIDLKEIPRSSLYEKRFSAEVPVLSPGEDYSLLFTVSPQAESLFQKRGFKLIGRVGEKAGGRRFIFNRGELHPKLLFEHFR